MPSREGNSGQARKRLSASQALAELRESEERFRSLFEQAPVAYHEIDCDGTVCRVNRAECLLLGFEADELLGRPIWDLVAPEERETSRAAVRRKLAGEQALAPFRREFTRRDGARLILEIHENYIHGAEGRIVGLRSTMLDATARQRAEDEARRAHETLELRVRERTAELARANERLALQYAAIRALTESSNLPAAAARVLESLCRHLNLQSGALWLLEDGRLQSHAVWGEAPHAEALSLLEPAPGQGLPGRIWSNQRPTVDSGSRGELLGDAAIGGPAPAFGVGFPIMAGGRLRGVMAAFGEGRPAGDPNPELLQTLNLLGRQIGNFMERTAAEEALQRSERRFSVFMDHLPGIAFIKDIHRRYVYVSGAVQPLLGWRREDMLGHTDEEIFPAEAALLSRETDGYVVETGRATEGVQEVPAGGQPRSWLVYKFPILDAETRPVMIGGVAIDITDRKQLEEQLRQSQKMEAMGRLAGGVAHDFNNILTIIGGYGRMVMEQLQPESPVRANLQSMLDAADRAAVLTGQLLAFSRRQVVQPKLLDLNQVIATVEKMLRRVIGEHIEIRTMLAPQPALVKADPGQIDQVLMNLAVNARDAMPQGGKLVIQTAVEDARVRLTFSDTGVGMNEEVKNRAFEPFFTTKARGKGTGLGLSMVYGIVRQHGGDIAVESEPGAGARFEIVFPAASEAAGEETGPKRKLRSTQGTETILLVEDETAVRKMAGDILRNSGYRVLEAGDGLEALRVAEAAPGRIHLLLTDVVMPHMGGRELASEIHKRCGGVRVLFMSGYTDDVIHADVAAATNFLPKPFTPDGLTTKVRETLDTEA